MLKEIFYDWGGANLWLFHVINDLRGPFLDPFMYWGTQIGDHALFPVYLALIALAALVATARHGRLGRSDPNALAMRWLVAIGILCTAFLLDSAFLIWAKSWFGFPRPLLALPPGSVRVIGAPEYHRSLPSGHASFALLVAASLWPMLNRRLRWAAAGFVLWVGVSRVNVGAHFPADVLASWLTALPAVLLTRAAMQRCLSKLGHRASLSMERGREIDHVKPAIDQQGPHRHAPDM